MIGEYNRKAVLCQDSVRDTQPRRMNILELSWFLRNSSMGPQPRAQQRPETFYCIYVYFTKSVAIVITGIFTSSMTYTLVLVVPLRQSTINAILIREYSSAWQNSSLNPKPNKNLPQNDCH